MIARLRGRLVLPVSLSVDRPEAIGLAVVAGLLAGFGWIAASLWLAVVVGLQLAIGGFGAVWLIGPVRPRLGFARYATFAVAAVALTLFGRVLPPEVALPLVPVAALLLWLVLWTELRIADRRAAGWQLDLLLVGIVFAAGAGVWQLLGERGWPPPLALVLLLVAVVALRSAEARGWSGVQAVGQAALHVLATGQIAAALLLLSLPGLVTPAIVALVFHAWGGAAEALAGRASWFSVAREFGTLGLLALIWAFFLHQPV